MRKENTIETKLKRLAPAFGRTRDEEAGSDRVDRWVGMSCMRKTEELVTGEDSSSTTHD